MPISYGTQAITVQSLGRLAHQGSKSSPKLQETHVFSRVFEDSVAITVLGTNTDVPAHRRLETACPTGRYVVVYLAILAVPHMSVLPPSFLKLISHYLCGIFILLTTERNMVSSGVYFTGDGEKLFVASV